MTTYEKLLRERVNMRIDDLFRLGEDPLDHNGRMPWGGWDTAMQTPDMSIETIEQICVELACQMFAFSSRRASHLPILSAFRDREECEREERAVLARIKAGCEE